MIEKYFDGEIQEIVVGIGRCETERLHGKFASLQTFQLSFFSWDLDQKGRISAQSIPHYKCGSFLLGEDNSPTIGMNEQRKQ